MRYTLILLLLLSSCRSKHTTTTQTVHDTIIKSEVLKITPPRLDEIFIEDVCDSLGTLKTFNVTTNTGKVRTTLRSDQNTLKLEVNTDSIVDARVNEYIASHEMNDTVKTITKTKYPKFLWYLLAYAILLTAYTFRNVRL